MPTGEPSDASIFIMACTFVMRRALNVCQSTKTIIMEAKDALISVRYCSLSSSSSSCNDSNDVPIVDVYSSVWLRSQRAHSVSLWTSSLAVLECWNHWFSSSCSWSMRFLSIDICCSICCYKRLFVDFFAHYIIPTSCL